jgi:hypothetical protein
MRTRNRAGQPWLILAAALLIAAGCSGDSGTAAPPEPTPGDIVVSVAGAEASRALLIRLSGPGAMTNIRAATSAYQAYSGSGSEGVAVAVFGTFTAGPLLRISVPDTRAYQQYSAAVVESAGPSNAILAGPAPTLKVGR